MQQDIELRKISPGNLVVARNISHKAVQFATKAARANLPAVADDSHSNLGWNVSLKAFLSQSIDVAGEQYAVGVSLSPLKLLVLKADIVITDFNLESMPEANVMAWLDEALMQVGLKSASEIKLPYELPSAAETTIIFEIGDEGAALAALSEWFDFAHYVLSNFSKANTKLSPGPSPVRCWPHHFDIATYVGLEGGNFETAKGIGVGMSPGDESYGQPYFYINPWPHLDAGELPDAPNPGHWHTDGFVGAIATAEEILTLSEISSKFPEFINSSFSIGREKLGV